MMLIAFWLSCLFSAYSCESSETQLARCKCSLDGRWIGISRHRFRPCDWGVRRSCLKWRVPCHAFRWFELHVEIHNYVICIIWATWPCEDVQYEYTRVWVECEYPVWGDAYFGSRLLLLMCCRVLPSFLGYGGVGKFCAANRMSCHPGGIDSAVQLKRFIPSLAVNRCIHSNAAAGLWNNHTPGRSDRPHMRLATLVAFFQMLETTFVKVHQYISEIYKNGC